MRFDSRGLVSTYLSEWMPTGDVTRQSVAGYFAGGFASGTYYSNIDKLTFPTETKSTISAVTTQSRSSAMGFANSGTAGYVGAGGNVSGHDFSITRVTFATTEVASFLVATLSSHPSALNAGHGYANGSVAGYFSMGQDSGGASSIIDKLAFPAETISVVSPSFSSVRAGHGACADIGVAGYVGGGTIAFGTPKINSFEKMTFPTDTIAAVTPTLTAVVYQLSCMADSGVAGYWCGGITTPTANLSRIDKLTFPAETKSTLSATLTTASTSHGAMADSGVAGYLGGGNDAISGDVTRIDRISFPSDTKSTLTPTLTNAHQLATAFANCGVF